MTMKQVKRNLHRMIYTSSYDRGLQHTLEMWPEIIRDVADAELHIFYGWKLFNDFYKGNPASMKWMEKMNELMQQKGITEHGRLPQIDLVDEYLKSGIWVYSTHFGEINCISAIKAQAYGCEPVVVNYAALQETVQFGRKVEGDIYDKETKEKFLKELLDALKNPMTDEKRKEMQDWAHKKYEWATVAKDWSDVLHGK